MSLFKQAITSKYLTQTPIQIITRSYTKVSVRLPSKIDLKQSIFNAQKLIATLNNSKLKTISFDSTTVSSINSPVSDSYSDTFSLNGAKLISSLTSTCSSPIPTKKIEDLFNSDGNQWGGMVLESIKAKLHSINSFAIDVYHRIILFLGSKSNPELADPEPVYTPVLTPILDIIVKTKQDLYMDYVWFRLYQILLLDDPIEIQKVKLFELSEKELGNYNNQNKVEKYNFDQIPHQKKLPKTPKRAKFSESSHLKAQYKKIYKMSKRYNIHQPSR